MNMLGNKFSLQKMILATCLIGCVAVTVAVAFDGNDRLVVREAAQAFCAGTESVEQLNDLYQGFSDEQTVVEELSSVLIEPSQCKNYSIKRRGLDILAIRHGAAYESGLNAFLSNLSDSVLTAKALSGLHQIPSAFAPKAAAAVVDIMVARTHDHKIVRQAADVIIEIGNGAEAEEKRVEQLVYDTSLMGSVRISAVEAWFRTIGLDNFVTKDFQTDTVVTLGALNAFAGSGMVGTEWLKSAKPESRIKMSISVLAALRSQNSTVREWAVLRGPVAVGGMWYYGIADSLAKPFVDSTVSILNIIAANDVNESIREQAQNASTSLETIKEKAAAKISKSRD